MKPEKRYVQVSPHTTVEVNEAMQAEMARLASQNGFFRNHRRALGICAFLNGVALLVIIALVILRRAF